MEKQLPVLTGSFHNVRKTINMPTDAFMYPRLDKVLRNSSWDTLTFGGLEPVWVRIPAIVPNIKTAEKLD